MRLVAALALLLLLAPTGVADTVTFSIRATDAGFVVDGQDGVNPTLHVPPGSRVVLSFRNNASGAHDLHVGDPVDAQTPCCQRPGETARLAFDVAPDASGRIAYWSDQAPTALRGVFEIAQEPPRVRFTSPAEGASVGENVTANVTIVGTLDRTVRYALDGENVSGVTTATTFAFTGLSAGHHLLHVELVAPNGTTLEPRVFDERVVYRGRDAVPDAPGPGANDTAVTTTPARGTPGFAPALALGAAAAIAIASASRRRRR